ncbi:unnamed protein product [Clonostachys rhizophaga]|uniref:Uncharacterized protein n=1 Tax=Clonostachys rhizophaga TaxID=160324 RepID=A0A9N9W3C6_9HYPO|nr:unnamed protein product [Clonostachys rhizophaga]
MGPAKGQHKAPFRLVGNCKGLEPLELTPEQEGQMRDGTTQVQPRRQLMRWYFEQKLGVSQRRMDNAWMRATKAFWLQLLNKGHTRVSRDSMLGGIDALVWFSIARVFAPDSPLYPEYPFGKHPVHDENAPMSQEFDRMRRKLAVSLALFGSRTRAPPAVPRDLTFEDFKTWIVKDGLWGIVTIYATNEYSNPLPPPFQRPQTFASATAASTGHIATETVTTVNANTGTTLFSFGNQNFTTVPKYKPRKGCSEKVKALWEDSASFGWARCPSALLPGPFQVIVPHVPELFQLPQSHEVIRCIPQSRAIVRRQHYTRFSHVNGLTVVHKYAIGPDLDDGDIRDIDQQTADDMKGLWRITLNWALAVWSGNMIRLEEWLEMARQNVYPPMKGHDSALVIYMDLIEASHRHNLDTLDELIKRTNSIKTLFGPSERSRETLRGEVAKIQQNKQRSYTDRVNDMAELVFKDQGRLPRLGTNSPFEQHLLTAMWAISQSNRESAAGSSVSDEKDMWPTVLRVSKVVLKRIVNENIRKPKTDPDVEPEANPETSARPGAAAPPVFSFWANTHLPSKK